MSEAALARLNADASGRTWPKAGGSQGRPPLPAGFKPVGVRSSERSEKPSERSEKPSDRSDRPTERKDDSGSDSNSLSYVRLAPQHCL